MTLGANLEAEFHYIEHNIKGRSGYISEDPLDMFAVLRFPEDIPDDLLIELGQLMEQAHYAVAIQKIPFTNEEINMLAKAKTAKYLTLIQKNTLIFNGGNSRFFTPRDIRIYEKLSDPKVEW
jgi:hypothetical protein